MPKPQERDLEQTKVIFTSWLELQLDEPIDFEVLSEVIKELEPINPLFGTLEIIQFFRHHPDVLQKNLKVYRRGFE